MRDTLLLSATIAVTTFTSALAQSCTGDAFEYEGNWYCSPVSGIAFQNFPESGQYQKVSNANPGQCTFEEHQYSGSLAPFDEEACFCPGFFCLYQILTSRVLIVIGDLSGAPSPATIRVLQPDWCLEQETRCCKQAASTPEPSKLPQEAGTRSGGCRGNDQRKGRQMEYDGNK